MRTFFMKVFMGYLYIGVFTEYDIIFSFEGFVPFGFSIFANLVMSPIIRAIVWLPSLISLLNPEIPVTFLQWLVPGFFEHLISQGKY